MLRLGQRGFRRSWAREGRGRARKLGAGPALPLCEDLGLAPSPELLAGLRRDFTAEEKARAWQLAGMGSARPVAAGPPLGVWVVGPSASGKSLLAPGLAARLGARAAVSLDGDVWREVHEGFRRCCGDGEARGCVWRCGFDELKPLRRRAKQELFEAALRDRRELLVPDTVSEDGAVARLRAAVAAGYLCHVVALAAPRDAVRQRGPDGRIAELIV